MLARVSSSPRSRRESFSRVVHHRSARRCSGHSANPARSITASLKPSRALTEQGVRRCPSSAPKCTLSLGGKKTKNTGEKKKKPETKQKEKRCAHRWIAVAWKRVAGKSWQISATRTGCLMAPITQRIEWAGAPRELDVSRNEIPK